MTKEEQLHFYQEQKLQKEAVRNRPVVLEAGLFGVELVGESVRYFVWQENGKELRNPMSMMANEMSWLESRIDLLAFDNSMESREKYFKLLDRLVEMKSILCDVKECNVESIYACSPRQKYILSQTLECTLKDGTIKTFPIKISDTPEWRKQYVERESWIQ